MDAALVQALGARAHGCCEVCGVSFSQAGREIDHVFGRARQEEVEATCWLLCPRCHYAKTQNSPSASHWLEKFIAHCKRYGYAEAQHRAEARLQFVDTRRTLGAALGGGR